MCIIKNFIKIYFRENFDEIKYDLKTIENGFEIKFIDEENSHTRCFSCELEF